MTIQVNSAQAFACEAKGITVEADSTRGLPSFEIIGHANHIITESRARIRSAITNSGFAFPVSHLIINLAPAELPKKNTNLDLPIAISILALSHQLLPKDIHECLFTGELALDGKIRPIHGIVNILEYAEKRSYKAVYIPAENINEAKLYAPQAKTKIFPVQTLKEL